MTDPQPPSLPEPPDSPQPPAPPESPAGLPLEGTQPPAASPPQDRPTWPPAQPQSRQYAPRPQQQPVIQVVNRGGGFFRSVGAFITGLSVLSIVFLIGIGAGLTLVFSMGLWFAGPGMNQLILREAYREGGGGTVAVIPITGVIDGAQARFVRHCVEDVLADSSTRAVVLRVNSPGGSITPSDQIWKELGRLKDAGLPIVASYGSVAASGAYYISCHSDYIMAQETTITGSIGVIAQVMTFEGLLDKVGIEPVTLVASGSPEKNVANDIYRQWDEADRERIQIMIDSAYDIFHRRVTEGRSSVITDADRLDEISDGSIYTAQQALDNGLIDGIGYLEDAVTQAEQLAGILKGAASVEILFQRPTFLDSMLAAQTRQAERRDPFDAESIRSLVNDLGTVRIMYLMR